MAITIALQDPTSPISRFFDEHLPHHEPFARPWVKALRGRVHGKPMPAVGAHTLIGDAIEFRIGLDLAQTLPYAELATTVALTAGADAISSLGYEPPASDDADLSTWRKRTAPVAHDEADDHDRQVAAARLCWQLAYLESIAYSLSKTEQNSLDFLRAVWTYQRPEPSSEAIAVLLALWQRYVGPARSALLGLGRPIIAKPTFAERFGEGDLLAGHTLIEIKCHQRPEDSLRQTLRQVLAYALADEDDELSIESIGVYYAYQGNFVHWTLPRVLRSLSATGHADLAELRSRFAEVIAAERRLIQERSDS
ncbi:hypothetical protein ACIA49_04045 [Kribbella sp. NPDC051587]|uniref:hypothetical protein n=1 Tax=Kribbella sp. NPDC051587 TaxID=3364119 RepID=UPI00378FC299